MTTMPESTLTPAGLRLGHADGLAPTGLNKGHLLRAALFGMAFATICTAIPMLSDPDTLWHIAVGRWILDHRDVPHTDLFSSTKFGEPWIAKEWLSQVLYALAYRVGGWTAVVVL